MAYIGKDLNNLGDVQTLDNITFNAGAGPYNLQKDSVQVTDADTDSIMIAIDGVVQGGNYTVNSTAGTITFDFSVSSSSVCNFVKLFGSGVQNVPKDSSVTTTKLAADAVTSAKIADGTIVNADINNSAAIAITKLASSAITINGSAVSLGGSVTVGETKPTITSTSLIIPPSSATSVTIAGTNFASSSTVVPIVEAINSTGGVTRASVVSWASATSISATFNLASGDYRIRVENPDGNAAVSANAILQASVAPTWTTAAGSIATIAGGASIGSVSVAATSDSAVTYAKTSGTLPGGISIASNGSFSGTESGSTDTTTYSFDITATDAESQTAVRTFTITISHGATGGGQFN
tara:strand:- start:927 stop:1982 length:1056 start_codon:yes stop_codon:yes gene_type:complete